MFKIIENIGSFAAHTTKVRKLMIRIIWILLLTVFLLYTWKTLTRWWLLIVTKYSIVEKPKITSNYEYCVPFHSLFQKSLPSSHEWIYIDHGHRGHTHCQPCSCYESFVISHLWSTRNSSRLVSCLSGRRRRCDTNGVTRNIVPHRRPPPLWTNEVPSHTIHSHPDRPPSTHTHTCT